MDNEVRYWRRKVDANPSDAANQSGLNAALLRMNIIRTCVDGRWLEHQRVFNERGTEIVCSVSKILPVTFRRALLGDLLHADFIVQHGVEIDLTRVFIEQDDGRSELLALQFENEPDTQEILLWIERNGYSPATLRDLLFIAEQHREFVSTGAGMIALGTMISPDDLQRDRIDELLLIREKEGFPWIRFESEPSESPEDPDDRGLWFDIHEDMGPWDCCTYGHVFFVRPPARISGSSA